MVNSLLVHPEDLTREWIDRMAGAGIRILGIHPAGGKKANDSLSELLERLKTSVFRSLLDHAAHRGLLIEYEIHAVGYLLPRDLFASHPEYFRMNEEGDRTPDYNFCVSDPEAMALVTQRAVDIAKALYRSRPFYYFWMDDRRHSRCMCPKCRELSGSDQQLLVINTLAEALKTVHPEAKVAYLAYHDHINPPRNIKPLENVFLEYAPIERYLANPDPGIVERELAVQEPLAELFGKTDMKVLEYWYDNSLFSGWTRPPRKWILDEAAMERDIAHYRAWGAQQIASFACYLGPDYEALYGPVDLRPFARLTNP